MTIEAQEIVGRVGISRELLETEVLDQHLGQIAALLPNWESCAERLELTVQERRELDDTRWFGNPAKVEELLKKWHRKLAFNAKYVHLVELCLSFGLPEAATLICNLLKGENMLHFSVVIVIAYILIIIIFQELKM